MSGSWKDRLERRAPLKPADVEAALRELAATVATIVAAGEALTARVVELTSRLDAEKATHERGKAPQSEAFDEPRPARRAKT